MNVRGIRFALALVCLAPGFTSCSDSSAPDDEATFVFRESLTGDVIHVDITDQNALGEADRLRQSGEERWVVGTLVRGDGGFNAPWTWHLDPASISFAEVTIEACQTAASAIADDIDYWVGFGQVCIWGVVEARQP